eukprot:TRINITY_DN2001_c0_g1_i1.p1 TRINITY_DN2001_c0_g1~~TRINITY_DN2001_c0_g1_i1.p1  ORF type:complete len:192 (+),score=41.41 TRINITY_DN2001_c0_g1_i1:674-1249(+)
MEKRKRSQLSKSSLIRSHHKVYEWKRNYIQNNNTILPIPSEYLESDRDPALYTKDTKTVLTNTSSNVDEDDTFYSGLDFETIYLPNLMREESCFSRRKIPMKEWLQERYIKQQVAINLKDWLKENQSNTEPLELTLQRYRCSEEYDVPELISLLDMNINDTLSVNELLDIYWEEVEVAQLENWDNRRDASY